MIPSPAKPVNEKRKAPVFEFANGLRAAEKLVLGFLAYAIVASILFPLSIRERLTVGGLNLVAGSTVFLLSRFGEEERTKYLSTIRDWLPCILILLAYRESGLFFTPDPVHRLDHLFIRWDSVLLKNPWVLVVLSGCSPWIQHYLEVSYFLCYPLVPCGFGSLVVARRMGILGRPDAGRAIDHFWTAVLLAVFCCYIAYPIFPLTPPRTLFNDVPGPPVRALFRQVNFWILGQYGVQACIFPSGHVAGVTATALALRAYLPHASVVFLIAAASVAAATVYGRYHYAADAVAGALVGLAAAFVSWRIHKPY